MINAAFASPAEVVDVKLELTPANKYNIHATIKHKDEGWDHYANAWRIYSPDGKLIAERKLFHPHVDEQQFTRSLFDVVVPPGVSEIVVKATCSATGEEKNGYKVKLK